MAKKTSVVKTSPDTFSLAGSSNKNIPFLNKRAVFSWRYLEKKKEKPGTRRELYHVAAKKKKREKRRKKKRKERVILDLTTI